MPAVAIVASAPGGQEPVLTVVLPPTVLPWSPLYTLVSPLVVQLFAILSAPVLLPP